MSVVPRLERGVPFVAELVVSEEAIRRAGWDVQLAWTSDAVAVAVGASLQFLTGEEQDHRQVEAGDSDQEQDAAQQTYHDPESYCHLRTS